MKRWMIISLLALLLAALCGCSRLVPSSYTLVTPHDAGAKSEPQSDVLTVRDYKTLKNALRTLVQNGVEHGVIHTNQYAGDVEEDLPAAVYEIAREDPIGAYAIDYITHDCTLIVAYYEIKIDITFRDVRTPLDEIEYVGSETEANRLLCRALENYDDHLTLYATYPGKPDYEALVQDYCDAHLKEHAAQPELTVTSYPADARNRIVELVFDYPASRLELRSMQQDVTESLRAAEIYVRYCTSETEKAALLFTYLAERFPYQEGSSRTPVYSALCQGIADSKSMAQSWQLLCDEAGLTCQTVSGMRGSESYYWNIMKLDGGYCHVDILRDLLGGGTLRLRYDEDMTGEYYWDQPQMPACPAPVPEEEPPIEEEPEPPAEEDPGETVPSEEEPAPPEEMQPPISDEQTRTLRRPGLSAYQKNLNFIRRHDLHTVSVGADSQSLPQTARKNCIKTDRRQCWPLAKDCIFMKIRRNSTNFVGVVASVPAPYRCWEPERTLPLCRQMQGSVGKAAEQQAAGKSLVFRAAEFGDKLEHCAAGISQRRGSVPRQRPHVVDRALRADGFASGCSQKRQIVRAE